MSLPRPRSAVPSAVGRGRGMLRADALTVVHHDDSVSEFTDVHYVLDRHGLRVLTAAGDDLTATDDAFKVAMRQIAGAFAQLEKARLVGKLRAARERKRASGAKVEGRKSHGELRPEVVALAKRLYRASPKTGQRRSLRAIAAELAQAGHVNERGRPYAAQSVKAMLEHQASTLCRAG